MEGAVERGERGVMDLFLFILHALPVLVVTSLAPFLGFRLSLFLQGLVLSYIFWILKVYWERERRQIEVEERKKINAKKARTDGETLRWMNEGLKAMWPINMQKFASKHFFIPMAPWFLERFKPPYVKEVTLQSLHLGSTPPDFSLIRALPSPQDARQDGDDVVFEANMEFLSDKDMNAEMTVQMRGLKFNFYISRLYIKGTVKFSVKFVKGWPVIGRVRFSFAHTPTVNMTARPWYGPDVRYFPGAAKWLEETMGTALEHSVVEPYMLTIDFEKLVSNMMISDLMPRQGFQEFFGVEPKSGSSQTVLVEILEAGDLKPPNGAGSPDLFVEVTLGGTPKWRTKSQTKTLNPVWTNEVQRIPIVNWALPNLLTMQVISKRSMKNKRQLGICSVAVNDYRNGERHVKKLTLVNGDRKDSTGWIRVAITVENSQGVEEPAASIGSQPSTPDLESISPPLSAAATTISTPLIHTRSTSTEDIAAPHEASEEGGSSEIIKMPYGTDGAFSIEFPGEGEPLLFPDPPTTSAQKPKNEKAAFESKDGDAKVKRSMRSILRPRKRSTSKVSQEISPPEREMTLSEHSGYSSLDHSTELTIYHGALNLNLLSPKMPSREPPHGDIRPLKLETVLSENRQTMKTPDLGHGHNNINLTEPQPHQEVKDSSFSRELIFSSQRGQEPEKQNSKNSWWKSWTKRPKRRTSRSSSKRNTVSEHDRPEDASYDPSDTSASQSFRKEPQDLVKELLLQPEDNVTTTDNGHSILTCGRSKSCRQDSHSKKIGPKGVLSQSMRLEPSPSLLKTIHERQSLDRPQH